MSTRRARFTAAEYHRRQWIKRLRVRGLPAAHVAVVMGLDESEVARLDVKPRRIVRNRPRPVPCKARLGSKSGLKVKRLASLGYDAPAIAVILNIDPAVVARYLERLHPRK